MRTTGWLGTDELLSPCSCPALGSNYMNGDNEEGLVGCEARGRVQWHNQVRRNRTRLNQTRQPRFRTPNQDSFCHYTEYGLDFHQPGTVGWCADGQSLVERSPRPKHGRNRSVSQTLWVIFQLDFSDMGEMVWVLSELPPQIRAQLYKTSKFLDSS